MSSSNPSTKKTRTWRSKVLEPAGFVKLGLLSSQFADLVALRDFLQTKVSISNEQRDCFLPDIDVLSDIIAERSCIGEDIAETILLASKRLARQANSEGASTWNEANWQRLCHTPSLESIIGLFSNEFIMSVEEKWNWLNMVEEGISLPSHKPDYTFTLQVKVDEPSVLSRDFLDSQLRRLDPYVNELSAIGAYPFATVESKSFQGAVLEAENQCGESVVKMLFKLRQLGGEALKLPVLTIALVGSLCIMYLGTSKVVSNGKIRYYMKDVWSGMLSNLNSSIEFHIMFYRYLEWVRGTYQPTIMTALERVASEAMEENMA